MQNNPLPALRQRVRQLGREDENTLLSELIHTFSPSAESRAKATQHAKTTIAKLRETEKPGIMEAFLAEYGLSSDEGIALMTMAEALLRVPDKHTVDALIEDKLVPSDWSEHLGDSPSMLVNSATLGLVVSSKLIQGDKANGLGAMLMNLSKRLSAPVLRVAVRKAMQIMGHQFVLGETIESAYSRGGAYMQKGFTYSFDMLGEAAITQHDADKYFHSYKDAIEKLAKQAQSNSVKSNPGISIKLSALHPRYESTQQDRVMAELVPKVRELALLACEANLGLNIDAEESERLDISLSVIEAVMADQIFANWQGFGVVVQAYNKSASAVIDWLYALAIKLDRKIMVRLVKGAYWDSEIKRAQVEGLNYFPVYTRKSHSDISYLCCASKLFAMNERIYPQFATHNVNTVSAILTMAPEHADFEFQRLHGMGEGVYNFIRKSHDVGCRIYAPVGGHKELLAYLVRRLLENGANSSFVNQLYKLDIPLDKITDDPFAHFSPTANSPIKFAQDLFRPQRPNSTGWDLYEQDQRQQFDQQRQAFAEHQWSAKPLVAGTDIPDHGETVKIVNPALNAQTVGQVREASESEIQQAIHHAIQWTQVSPSERALVLNKVADLLESNTGELCALLMREAGKNAFDVIAEIREAVDFLRYYSAQANTLDVTQPRGIFVCISPWNFPLAIFIGQISAALAAGNGVLAKPAESTPLIAYTAIQLFHRAGVPLTVLQLLPGTGAVVGNQLTQAAQVSGVCFTGSTATAVRINRNMAEHLAPSAPLIAETGGLNAMIIDSTALPEQAIQDVVRSAFQSAGQRCSALRVLYLQDDVFETFMQLLTGSADELVVGNPWHLCTDVGPVISAQAQTDIKAYIDEAKQSGRLLYQYPGNLPQNGYFVPPTVIEVNGIQDMPKEVFGPVLHVAKFSAGQLANIVEAINNSGYGLTFGVHSRIASRTDYLVNHINVGNIYVNRDQIGAIVGSQPFGGEGLSGTGPKAGGPHYLHKFMQPQAISDEASNDKNTAANALSAAEIQGHIDRLNQHWANQSRNKLSENALPGPTGESNVLSEYPRGLVLCLGPTPKQAKKQAEVAQSKGCPALQICPGAQGEDALDGLLPRAVLTQLSGLAVVASNAEEGDLTSVRRALAEREGAILPLISDSSLAQACVLERHVCIDTTAAGGNATLLAQVSD